MVMLFPFLVKATKITLPTSQVLTLRKVLNDFHFPSETVAEKLLQSEVISESLVQTSEENKKKFQTMKVKVVGLHSRTCQWGLQKISRYELYKEYISFVKDSRYYEEKKMIHFLLDHDLMPFSMTLDFQLPRIQAPGKYEFVFPGGFFAGLKGDIHVTSLGNRCLYLLTANWKGAHTQINDFIIQNFSQTLARMGLEKLIRFSTL
jgi:hypothetical protein